MFCDEDKKEKQFISMSLLAPWPLAGATPWVTLLGGVIVGTLTDFLTYKMTHAANISQSV